MKNRRLISMLLSATLFMPMFSGSVSAATGKVAINAKNFPDANFRSYLSSNWDIDDDGYFDENERYYANGFDVENCNISSLEGIEYFPNIVSLFCNDNNLTSLDLSKNTNLEYLVCDGNNLSSLDVSHNTVLRNLSCGDNNLTSLDLSKNTNLWYLTCNGNNLSSLDLSHNTELYILHCYYNNLSSIDFSNNSYLVDIINASEPGIGHDANANCVLIWERDGYDSLIIDDITITANGSTLYGDSTPSSDSTGMTAFAERLYTEALGRSYDESGRDYWVSQLRSGMSGADAARQFFFSAEFTNANYSDDVYVTRLYRTFMGRTPDEGGKSYWVSQLTSGAMTREDVFNGFINSTEWANLCLQSGIISGGTQAPTISVEPSEEVTAFATRLYTTCLGRAADSAGVSWWATELANMRRTGTTAAKGFFFSDEYVSANHSDAEFVTALYRTFMGRECDQAGYDYWMGELASGCTRENVLERFAGCDEFGNICADAGIIR